jgi:mono/diheme cytochrome c family protein
MSGRAVSGRAARGRLPPSAVLGLALGSVLALALGSALALASTLAASSQGGDGAQSRPSGLAAAPRSAAARRDPYQGKPEAVMAGRKLFLRHCAECHGEDTRGGRRAPPLSTNRVREAPPGDLFWFLTNGDLRKGMPSWSRLPAAQRWQLTAYLETLGGG